MPTPVLIDTDMGIDDALAVALALTGPDLHLTGVVSVAGNVPLDQATDNIGRWLTALRPEPWPLIGKGLEQRDGSLLYAQHVHGEDGLGGIRLPDGPRTPPMGYENVYEACSAAHSGALVIIAVGPLTNLAALLRSRPEILHRVSQVVIMGGAIWCAGNVTPHAEFNFYRDPEAAMDVFASGLPITLVPLDVTKQLALDESHAAHLARSGRRAGDLLAQLLRFGLGRDVGAGAGQFIIHDALAVGAVLWPQLFLRTRMGLDVITSGPQAGKCKPKMVKDKSRQVSVVMSVKVVDFLENLLEALCHEPFVV